MIEDKVLEDLYYNPKSNASFGGFNRLYQSVKNKQKGNRKYTEDDVKQWLSGQQTYTLFRDRLKNKYPTSKYEVTEIDEQWSIDLADMQLIAKQNKGFRYLLCVIDVFSKYAWVKPLKTKSGVDVTAAMLSIFQETQRQPLFMNGDAGKEFLNVSFKKLLSDYGVKYFISYGVVKASIAERFIRTLKSHIWRYFKHFNTWTYINNLQNFIYAYNHSKHRTIGVEPANVTLDKSFEIWKKAFNPLNRRALASRKIPKFKVGDIVRLSITKGVFEKGYVGTFSEGYYVIYKVKNLTYPFTYKLKEFDTGNPINGVFYEQNLQKIAFTKNQLEKKIYNVEKIIATKLINGVKYYFVKFKGFPSSYNKWIPESNVKRL